MMENDAENERNGKTHFANQEKGKKKILKIRKTTKHIVKILCCEEDVITKHIIQISNCRKDESSNCVKNNYNK